MSKPKIILATRKDPRTADKYLFASMLTSMPKSVPTHILYGVFVSNNGQRLQVDLSGFTDHEISMDSLHRYLDERDMLDHIDLVEVVIDQNLIEEELIRRSDEYLGRVFN